MGDYYAMRGAVIHEMKQYCSEEFFKNHYEQMYLCYRIEYEPYFDERAFGMIKEIVRNFQEMYGEE